MDGIENCVYMLNTSKDILSLLESLLEYLEIVPDCFNKAGSFSYPLTSLLKV